MPPPGPPPPPAVTLENLKTGAQSRFAMFRQSTWLLLATLGGSLLVYQIVRRSGPMRPLWGLKRHPVVRAPTNPVATPVANSPAEAA